MILKKPTKKQYEALFGTLEEQIRTVLTLAFNDDGSVMFEDADKASYSKFRKVLAQVKDSVKKDVDASVLTTPGLTCIDIFVREVEQMFSISDADARFDALKDIVRTKLRLNGLVLTDAEYDELPYADQLVAVNNSASDVIGDSPDPLPESAKG